MLAENQCAPCIWPCTTTPARVELPLNAGGNPSLRGRLARAPPLGAGGGGLNATAIGAGAAAEGLVSRPHHQTDQPSRAT